MKTTKQLLQLTLDYLKKADELTSNGICYLLQVLNGRDIITREEFHLVNDYIKANRPKEGKFYDEERKDTIHFWDPKDLEIRIEWMEHLINNL